MQLGLQWLCLECGANGEMEVSLPGDILNFHSVMEFWPVLGEAHKALSPDCPVTPNKLTVGLDKALIQKVLDAGCH